MGAVALRTSAVIGADLAAARRRAQRIEDELSEAEDAVIALENELDEVGQWNDLHAAELEKYEAATGHKYAGVMTPTTTAVAEA